VADLVGLLAANRGFNCSLAQAIDGRIVRCGIISCHFRDCKSAITSTRYLLLSFYHFVHICWLL